MRIIIKKEQIEAMHRLGNKGAHFGEPWDVYLES